MFRNYAILARIMNVKMSV